MTRTINRQCTLCEAHCGIQVEVEGERVLRISGDPDDVLSKGYICPKAAALADLQSDPDRLRRPVKKVGGRFVEIGWSEAFSLAAERPAGGARATRGRRRGHLSRQSRGALLGHLHGGPRTQAAGVPQRLLGHLGGPAAPVPQLARDVRPLCGAADPRHRTDPPPARDRSQPGGVQRLADDRPGGTREDQDDPCPGREGGRGRPPPHRDREARLRARGGQARGRPLPAAGDAERDLRRWPGAPRPPGRPLRRTRGPASSRRAVVRPSGWPPTPAWRPVRSNGWHGSSRRPPPLWRTGGWVCVTSRPGL